MHRIINSSTQAVNHATSICRRGGGRLTEASDELRAIRQRLNLTQRQFAEIYGFEVNSIKSWESGRRKPDRANSLLIKLISLHPSRMQRYVALCLLTGDEISKQQLEYT